MKETVIHWEYFVALKQLYRDCNQFHLKKAFLARNRYHVTNKISRKFINYSLPTRRQLLVIWLLLQFVMKRCTRFTFLPLTSHVCMIYCYQLLLFQRNLILFSTCQYNVSIFSYSFSFSLSWKRVLDWLFSDIFISVSCVTWHRNEYIGEKVIWHRKDYIGEKVNRVHLTTADWTWRNMKNMIHYIDSWYLLSHKISFRCQMSMSCILHK